MINRQINRIEKCLQSIVNNDHLLETLQTIYDKRPSKINPTEIFNNNNAFSSKFARRLLVLVFVQLCQERLNQIERLHKLIPLIFRSNQVKSFIHSS